MTKIIGHRGAAGLALENSAAAFRAAIKHGVHAVEFDVRLTKDRQLVVLHDKSTRRVASLARLVHEHTLAELRRIPLKNGEHLLSLDDALALLKGTPAIIEFKDRGCLPEALTVLARHPRAAYSFASFQHDMIRQLRQQFPDAEIFALEHFKPIEIIQNARRLGVNGIGINMWLMNPLTYWLAKRYKLDIYVYTVNSRRLAQLLLRLYPGISFHTNRPDRLRCLVA